MTQFIMYTTYSAYQCTPEAGGFEKGTTFGGGTYWGSWTEVRDQTNRHGDFEKLNASYGGKELNCYGVENKLPLSQGAWEEVEEGIREDDFWINDQEGEYSKRQFTITEKNSGPQGVQLGPCVAYNEESSGVSVDFTFYVTDETVPNIIRYYHTGTNNPVDPNRGLGMTEVNDFQGGSSLSPSDCMFPDDGYAGLTDEGPIGTLTVIGADGALQRSTEVDAFGEVDNLIGGGDGWDNRDVKEWKLCPGTKGYIQVNTGKNSNEQGPSGNWNDRGSQDYSVEYERFPGSPDIEAAGSGKANTIHPFIVLTEHKTGC
ncbi:hypothetical protein U3A55_02545 [Salarchaeum sp. III]|uniref:hypothetical protein n=1 Tax=Salarchaeum sp. III TaxID=3107927 RepID=UPI002ED85D68